MADAAVIRQAKLKIVLDTFMGDVMGEWGDVGIVNQMRIVINKI